MQHEDQHKEAIRRTVKAKNEITASIFDDKIRKMGTVNVQNGVITIQLDYVPHMTEDFTSIFLTDSISVALRECFNVAPDTFNKVL